MRLKDFADSIESQMAEPLAYDLKPGPFKKASEQTIKDRRKICMACEYSSFIDGLLTCRICGCNLTLKISNSDSDCPVANWERE